MKQGAKKLCFFAGSLALIAGAWPSAAATVGDRQTSLLDSPYNPIVERNIFDLHDPPPPPEPKPTNAPPPNIHLTGIPTILGKKQAYFMVQSAPVGGKPAQQDKFMTLSEGQRQEMLEVLEINPKAKLVKISNSGNVSTITFETNKIAYSAAAGGGAAGNAAAHMGGMAPNPAPNYYPNAPANVPPRPMRPTTANDPGAYGGGTGQFGGYQANANGAAGGYGNQAYNYNSYPNAAAQRGQAAPVPQIDPEQQIVLMELQREATKSAVANGQMPPLPPTPLSQLMQQEQQQGNQQQGAPAPNLPVFPGQHNTIR
jgi:hypothetical protein